MTNTKITCAGCEKDFSTSGIRLHKKYCSEYLKLESQSVSNDEVCNDKKYSQGSMKEEFMQKKEEIEPKKEEEFGCPACNEIFVKKYKICPNCGVELSW